MSNVVWSCMSMVQLLEYIEDGRYPTKAIDEIIVRAKAKGMGFAAYVNYCLKIEIDGVEQHTIDPQATRKPAAAKRQENTVQSSRIKDVGKILNSVMVSRTVLPACEALLWCNWNFIDPGYTSIQGWRNMEKTPDEVRGFLQGIIDGFHPSWENMGAGPRGLLKMIIDAYFRAYNEQMENAK